MPSSTWRPEYQMPSPSRAYRRLRSDEAAAAAVLFDKVKVGEGKPAPFEVGEGESRVGGVGTQELPHGAPVLEAANGSGAGNRLKTSSSLSRSRGHSASFVSAAQSMV